MITGEVGDTAPEVSGEDSGAAPQEEPGDSQDASVTLDDKLGDSDLVESGVGVGIGVEPLEDIIEEDEEDPIDREELLAETKVATCILRLGQSKYNPIIYRRCY